MAAFDPLRHAGRISERLKSSENGRVILPPLVVGDPG